ncbi:hypothetical protein C2W62_02365 [Candidatus Entotheonella serta]|nr:hypothetical protein C2W62_02365 [Candidatus Entotheonella serta]
MLSRKEEGAANGTVNRGVALLRSAYNFAVRDGVIDEVYMPHFEFFDEREAVRTGFLTEGDLVKVTDELPEHYKDLLWFGFYFCWRLSEIINLEWREVSMTQRRITLSPTKVKNREIRILPIEAEIADIIGRRMGKRVESCPYVFHRDGTKHYVKLWKPFKRAFRAAGYPNNTFHDLRRSGIRRLVLAGIPQAIIMKISGHKTDEVFRR